jgi:hypothetical protein
VGKRFIEKAAPFDMICRAGVHALLRQGGLKVALIKCPDCGKDVSDVAPSCPNCGRPIMQTGPATEHVGPATEVKREKKPNRIAMGCLILLLVVVGLWVIGKFADGPTSSPAVKNDTPHQTVVEPQLALVAYSWSTESGYAILEGQVKNISSQSLQNVTAVASFYDANGGFITTSDALIDYNPILPGQTSPFKVMKTENPAMKKANVEFKYLMGGSIPFQRATKK